ncbi:MAG TPA: trimethylamine methyltransferase family protein [Steroidobacteraceae bacterium]|jgi:trimethylamine--corrinoid protein Co-methyltransferase|nr:trimethylamine methyltransferase family protein [Steroidobacteraceae bacterium]
MTEPPATSPRRRERGGGRGTRSTGPSLAPIARLENRWPPLEILTAEQVERIVVAGYRVLEEAGLEIRSTAAREVYRRAGALVDDATQMVRIGRDIVEANLKLAPASFVLHARNPERHLHVGGDVVNFGPVTGAPHINDREHGRRYGDIESFRNILRLIHSLGVLHWQGGIVVEPVDLPVAVRHLAMYQEHIECSDIVWAARGIGGVQAQDAIAMSAIEHGCTVEDLAARPTLMTVTNVNSPRRVDEEILDNIMIMARHGQCVVITPFTLMGAMAPVTLAGALVQQTAEALGIVTLCQMLRPGSPCVLGGFTSNVDMRTGSPAFGTPEYVHAVIAAAQIGRRLKLPVRTSAVNASPVVDAQSTYETAFSLQAAILSHSHLVNHAAGWLEGGLSASLEKIIVDAELLRNWAEMLKPVSFDDDDLAVEAIKAVAAGGHFFGEPHTLARYQSAFYRPLLSDWSNFESWTEAGSRNATERATGIWKKLLTEYVPPPLDPAVKEAIADYVARRTGELSTSG